MDSSKIRELFLEFFKSKGHAIVPSSSLLPTDSSVLFTTAGMQQFKPYYLGEPSPYGKNTASVQKCFRTSDIEEVGDERHLTFFEMLGNFSFGGYFKEEAIKFAYEFVVKELKLEIDYVTVFSPAKVESGDWRQGVPEDNDSFEIWKKLGVPEDKIKKEGADNFWGPTGDEGPCGPTTEIYAGGIEIWNIVFNQYYCNKEKKLEELKIFGIDTGMGLERLAMVMQKNETVFETDLFSPIIAEIEKLSGRNYKGNEKAFRVIADHIKSSVFLAGDGILPSNISQGYILRRLIRRAIRFGKTLEMPANFLNFLSEKTVNIYKDVYPELSGKKQEIFNVINAEEEKFGKTLEKGLKEIERIPELTGEKAFSIYETYGFPLEMAEEIKPVKNREDFFVLLKKHQELSRTASAGMFKGGLADSSIETTKLHTAAHIMLAGLRKVLGEHVAQKGANINAERLRFDFSHKEKMTAEEIKAVEDFVNEIISKDLPVRCDEMGLEKAKEINATGEFGSKYGEVVKVYTIGGGNIIVSREICGGPHVERTGILGKFKIIKEESCGAGVRRVKAILE